MAAGSPSPMVSVRTPGHACRAPPHEVDLSAQQTGRSRVEVERPAAYTRSHTLIGSHTLNSSKTGGPVGLFANPMQRRPL